MKIVIVSNEIVGPTTNGGIGSFCTHLAQVLSRQTDHDIVLLYTFQGKRLPRSQWIDLYTADGIDVIDVPPDIADKTDIIGGFWFVRRSRQIYKSIPADADVVIFQENNANGFYTLRKYRFQPGFTPVTATVLHSSADWIRGAMEQLPGHFDALVGNFGERYGAQHSDYVLSLSQYMADWVRDYGWQLPPNANVRTTKGPFLPRPDMPQSDVTHADRFKRLIYFGRLETRKGLEVFVDALVSLQKQAPNALANIKEIVFVGREANHRFATIDQIAKELAPTGAKVIHHGDWDTFTAQRYLADHAADSLVVLPSRVDNHPYALMETSLIPGLNFIASNVGGIPEIVGERGQHQLFPPTPRGLMQTLQRWLQHGPLPDDQLGRYDYETANRNWVNIAQEMCQLAADRRANPPATPDPANVTVDVITVWNDPKFPPVPLLQSLEQQTTQDYTFYLYNNIPANRADFYGAADIMAAYRQQYAHRDNWHFIDADIHLPRPDALNHAANLGTGDVMIFVDSSNVAANDMVEKFRLGLITTGEACLTANAIMFDVPQETITLGPLQLLRDLGQVYLPLGNAPEIAPFWNPFGLATDFAVQREVFDLLGGFPTFGENEPDAAVQDGDYSFFVDLALSGYSMDVLPEYLTLHRLNYAGRHPFHVSFTAQSRVHLTFASHLGEAHLGQLTMMGWGMGADMRDGQWFKNALGQEVIAYEQVINSTWLAQNVPVRYMLPGLARKVLNKLIPSTKPQGSP